MRFTRRTREAMANRVMRFCWGLPSEARRPWDGNPDHSISSWHEDVASQLSRPEGMEGLARHMDQTLACLPLDFGNYGERARILSELHGHAKGRSALFPERKDADGEKRGAGKGQRQGEGRQRKGRQDPDPEGNRQMSLFDFMDSGDAVESNEEAPVAEREEDVAGNPEFECKAGSWTLRKIKEMQRRQSGGSEIARHSIKPEEINGPGRMRDGMNG